MNTHGWVYVQISVDRSAGRGKADLGDSTFIALPTTAQWHNGKYFQDEKASYRTREQGNLFIFEFNFIIKWYKSFHSFLIFLLFFRPKFNIAEYISLNRLKPARRNFCFSLKLLVPMKIYSSSSENL